MSIKGRVRYLICTASLWRIIRVYVTACALCHT